jgi:hypothetical protein
VHSYGKELENNYLKIAFINLDSDFIYNIWYVYKEHIDLFIDDKTDKANEIEIVTTPLLETRFKGKQIEIPSKGLVYLTQPIVPGVTFNWAEATKNGTRIPDNTEIIDNIIKVSKILEEVRIHLGNKPIYIKSWYRDLETNKKVGGAFQSRHMLGDAVDFVHSNLTPLTVFKILEPWYGSRGGLASSNFFTHIDARGYKARWSIK